MIPHCGKREDRQTRYSPTPNVRARGTHLTVTRRVRGVPLPRNCSLM